MAGPFDDEEYERWIAQAAATLADARKFHSLDLHHWASFAAQQAAEAAAKALVRGFGKPVVTHSMKQLFDAIEALGITPPEACRHAGRVLERHYKGARHPDEFAAGTPRDYYDELIAKEALDEATAVLEFVRKSRAAL